MQFNTNVLISLPKIGEIWTKQHSQACFALNLINKRKLNFSNSIFVQKKKKYTKVQTILTHFRRNFSRRIDKHISPSFGMPPTTLTNLISTKNRRQQIEEEEEEEEGENQVKCLISVKLIVP